MKKNFWKLLFQISSSLVMVNTIFKQISCSNKNISQKTCYFFLSFYMWVEYELLWASAKSNPEIHYFQGMHNVLVKTKILLYILFKQNNYLFNVRWQYKQCIFHRDPNCEIVFWGIFFLPKLQFLVKILIKYENVGYV